MISVDTNVLARFVLADDAGQHRRAVAALEADEDLFIPVTVLLELAWVLGAGTRRAPRSPPRCARSSACRARMRSIRRRCGARSTGWMPGWTSPTHSTWR